MIAAARPNPTPDLAEEIADLDALVEQERTARHDHERALAGVQRAQGALEAAEADQRVAEGPDAIATAIAAASGARDALAVAAREATGTREQLQKLTADLKSGWRSLADRARPALLDAEAAALAQFCTAAAELGRARIVLNDVRAALGGPPIMPLHIRVPGSDANATEVGAAVSPALPFLEDVTRLRREIEDRRAAH